MENSNNNGKDIKPSFDNVGAYYMPVLTPKKSEPVAPMSKRDIVFSFAFFALTFLFVHFAAHLTLAYTIWFFIMFAVSTAYLYNKDEKPTLFTCLCGALSLVSAAANAIFCSWTVDLNALLCAFLFVIYIGGLSNEFRRKEGNYKLIFELGAGAVISPIKNIVKVFKAFSNSFSNRKSKVNLNVIVGAALAIPFLAVIIPLLASGDAAFKGLIDNAFSNFILDFFDYGVEFIAAIIIAPLLISYMYSKKAKFRIKSNAVKDASKKLNTIANSISVSFLSMISLTYIVYLFSQLAYFFSAFSGILPDDYEYSESVYARRGFYQIFVICIINILIIGAVSILTKKKNGSFSAPLKALECFICLMTMVFITTAMAKMWLNIQNFGLSVNRLLVSLLEVMMLVVVVFIVIHIFFPRVNYMQAIIIICSVLFIGFVYADMDAVVAKYNIEAYRSGALQTIDVGYLASLSDSALPYIADIAKDSTVNFAAYSNAKNEMRYSYIRNYDYLEINDKNIMEYNSKIKFDEYTVTQRLACDIIAKYFNSLNDADKQYFLDGKTELIK